MPNMRWVIRMAFVANFIRFLAALENFENRLSFDKVTESLKVGAFLRHSVVTEYLITKTFCQRIV